MVKTNRYENARLFTVNQGQSYVFAGMRPRNIDTAVGVLEYIVREGDRLDLLALHFYDNTRRWWRILDANPQIVFGADLNLESFIGEVILIPRATEAGGSR